MQHRIDPEALGPLGPDMAEAVERCVHCGFCLAACPTYRLTGEETQSPRGRIFLMKEVLEGGLEAEEAKPYLDSCLGCLACEPACPSGVAYGHLLQPYRARDAERPQRGDWMARARSWLVHRTVPYPNRFRLGLRLSRLLTPIRAWLPASLRPMVELAAGSELPRAVPVPDVTPAVGTRRARVAVLSGCAQDVLAPQILAAAVRVLSLQGVECVVAGQSKCCGALAFHDGHWPLARRLARSLWQDVPNDVDAVVSLAAGCGSALKETSVLMAGEADKEALEQRSVEVRDVCELLDDLGLVAPLRLPAPTVVAYQDACHLAQAQGIRQAPRRLLQQVDGLTLVSPDEADLCCGSAGTYNLEHPETARQLAVRKVDHLLATRAQQVASGNIGCIVQLQTELRRRGVDLPVRHTVEVLAEGSG